MHYDITNSTNTHKGIGITKKTAEESIIIWLARGDNILFYNNLIKHIIQNKKDFLMN